MRGNFEHSATGNDCPAGGPYAASAALYAENGWNPLPVFGQGKGAVPAGFTGYSARKVTAEDIDRWINKQYLGDNNVGLRLMYEVGIDIDSYDDSKDAGRTWEHLCQLHGEPPPTVRVSSRFGEGYDGLAGIKLYRLPRKYRPLVERRVWKGQAGSGIDLIRLGHRHVMVWPSLHPKRETRYQWLDERTGEIHDGPIPSPESLPELADVWVEEVLLKAAHDAGANKMHSDGHRDSAAESAHWTTGTPCKAVEAALERAMRELKDGRHDGALKHITALTRLGEQGHQGVRIAIGRLHEAFLQSTQNEQRDSQGEWDRMVSGVDSLIEAEGLTPQPDRGCCGVGKTKPTRKAADKVLDLAGDLFTLGRTIDDRPFMAPKAGANVALFSTRARSALADAYARRYDTTVSDKSIREAWTVIERRALDSDPVDLPIRVASRNGTAVVDLGTAEGRCVVIDAGGWRVESRSPVAFRRPKPLLPLKEPEPGGEWEAFWDLTNIARTHWDLVRGWLVSTALRSIPHPIVRIQGPQGAVKTTATKVLARVLDPSSGEAAKPPTTPDRWEMTVGSRWITPVDNVSHIPEWWADDLCRTVTGAATVDRELYTDDDVVVKSLRGAVILNGITMPGELRPDLLERTISIEVDRPATYLCEAAVEARVTTVLPQALGLVLGDLVAVLRHTGPIQDVADLRMNDFANTLARLDAAMGTRALTQYRANLDGLAADALDSDPVVTELVSFMEDRSDWVGTAEQLLRALNLSREVDAPEKWPRDGRRLSQWLMRATTTLQHAGLKVERLPRTRDKRLLKVNRI